MVRRISRRLMVPLILVSAMGLIAAGCGSSDDSENDTTATVTEAGGGGGGGGGGEASGGKTLEIKMGDYFFSPSNGSAPPGPTVIEAPNEGSVEHELVVFKTSMDPAKLPTEASGEVDEEKMDEIAESAGEIADVEAGDTKAGDFKLTPGKYVIFCNLPGHYAQGMYGTLTVK
jgi:uncharacterized cupredoxin-like copper-binding protein